MMAEGPVIKEHEALSNVLQAIPRKAQKGFFKVPLLWTCIDVNEEYIAVGTDLGLIYLYNRGTGHTKKLTCPVKEEKVSCVKMINSVDYLVAVGSSSGMVFMFQLPSNLPGRNKELLVYAVKDQHHRAVKCLEWSQNGMKLFSGDEDGVVCCSEIIYSEHKSQSYIVVEEPHPIVQLSYAHKHLLVSTRFRSFLCNMTTSTMTKQRIGTKDRKSLGNYGAVFLPGVSLPKDAVIFASRPGLRLWKANLEGAVQATYIFKELVTDVSQGIILLSERSANENSPGEDDTMSCTFGPLMLFEDTLLVTYHSTSLFVLDPGLGIFVAYHTDVGLIQSIAVCGEEIFLLRDSHNSQIIRLSRKSLCASATSTTSSTTSKSEVKTLRASGIETMLVDDSPVQRLSETANKMSESIKEALKGVGEKMQVIQEGEKTPPWGLTASKSDKPPVPGSEGSDSVDSAKEVSPSDIPSPTLDNDHVPRDVLSPPGSQEELPPGAPPIVCLDQSALTAIVVKPGTSSERDHLAGSSKRDKSLQALDPELPLKNREQLSGNRFDSIKSEPNESNIVVFTKQKRRKKKKIASRDKDSLSIGSEDSCESPPLDGKARSRDASPASNSNAPQSMRPSVLRARSPSPGLSARDVSDSHSISGHRERSHSPQQHTKKNKDHSSGKELSSIQNTKTSQMPVLINEQIQQDIIQGHKEKTESTKIASIEKESSKTDTPSLTYKHSISNVSPDDSISQHENIRHVENTECGASAGAIETKTSLETSKAIPRPDLTEDFMKSLDQPSGKTLQEVTAMGLPVSPALKSTSMKGTEEKSKAEAKGKSETTAKSVESNSNIVTPVSDSSVEDFYSKYKSQPYGSPSEEMSPTNNKNEPSIQDAVNNMSLTDSNKNHSGLKKQGSRNREILLADIWSEFPAPGNLSDMCITEKHIWCCDKTETLHYSSLAGPGLNWKKVPKAGGNQISLSPSGWLFWRLCKNSVFAATNVTPRNPYGTKWMEIARDVAFISVDESVAWYAKVNGEVVMQKNLNKDRPSFRPIKVKSPGHMRISQIVSKRSVVWALTEDRTIMVRVGITADSEEGTDWKFLQGYGPGLLVSGFDIGDQETAWVMDVVGRLWFTTGVTQERPEGNGKWWQVSLSEFLMQDSVAVDTLKSLLTAPQNLTRLLAGEKGAGLISVGPNGIWMCPGFGSTLHVCRGSVLGHRWDLVLPGGMVPSTKWLRIGANSVSGDSGYIWTQQPSLGMFCFPAKWKGAKVTEIAAPSITYPCTALSTTQNAVWVLLTTGNVHIRAGMGSHMAHGLQWAELDLTQLGNTKFVHLSCGSENVWGVDNKGNVYFRIGVDAPTSRHLNPAWVPVPGNSKGAGFYFVQVCTGPNDWMVWAVDNKKSVYVRKGITECMPIGTHWVSVQGPPVVSVMVGVKMVYAMNTSGEILARYGISQNNLTGAYWKKQPGVMEQISVTHDDDLWGIDKEGQLHQRVTYYHERSESLEDLEGTLSNIYSGSVEEGEWELL